MYKTKNFPIFSNSFGSLLEDLFQNGKVATDELWNENRMHVPVNITETEQAYELNVFAPGIPKDQFKLNVEKNVLTVSYEHTPETKEGEPKFLRKEFRTKSFKRSFTLNDTVNTEGIAASYTDGVLNVQLPKKEKQEPTTQSIQVS